MNEVLRWGVLGTARIVRKTIPALQETKNGEVVGIASRTEEKAREYAVKHGIAQAFGSYEALLGSRTSTLSTLRCRMHCTSSGF